MSTTATALDGWIKVEDYAVIARIKVATAKKKCQRGDVVASQLGMQWYVDVNAEVAKNMNVTSAQAAGRRRRSRRRSFP